MYQQPRANARAAPLYGNQTLTPEQQEAEDFRLAQQMQEEEERAAAAEARRVQRQAAAPPPSAPSRPGPTTSTRRVEAPRSAPATSTEDEDFKLALALAGDTPQDYDAVATQPAATFVPPERPPHRTTSSTTAVAPTRSPPARPVVQQPAAPYIVVPERQLTKEEQEAEDLRFAMEIQALEEAAALREGRPIPPRQPPQRAFEAASAPATTQPASTTLGSSRSTDLFNAISLPPNAPGVIGRAPSATNPPPVSASSPPPAPQVKRDLMDDLFAPSPPVAQVQQAAPAVQQPSAATTAPFDFFGPTTTAPNGSAPPAAAVWSGTTNQAPPRAVQATPVADPRAAPSIIDDLFAPAPTPSQPPPTYQNVPQSSQRSQPPPAHQAGDMNSNLDFFAATAKPQSRAW